MAGLGGATAAILILGAGSLASARRVQRALEAAVIHGLSGRMTGADADFSDIGGALRQLFDNDVPIVAFCAAGIVVRALAPLLADKRVEPPVLAVAEDGSAIVPLLGGLRGVNALARRIGEALHTVPAITTAGEVRFGAALENSKGWEPRNPGDARRFMPDLLAGERIRLPGDAPWLAHTRLPFAADGNLSKAVTLVDREPAEGELVFLDRAVPDPVASPAIDGPVGVAIAASPIAAKALGRSRGHLAVIGLGPGGGAWLVAEARLALDGAEDIVGYETYLRMAGPFRDGQTIHASDNRAEMDRARQALALAARGRKVAIVSSGDPGIFAMASAVMEALDRSDDRAWHGVELVVIPGVSAAQAAAARAGAPLGHDFCTLSLSDNLKPWPVIEQRLALAAAADLVLALYNPVSRARPWQLGRAVEIVRRYRMPATPVVLGRDLGRPGESTRVLSLAELSARDADMRTVVIIGSSATRVFPRADGGMWVYTPRRYEDPAPSVNEPAARVPRPQPR